MITRALISHQAARLSKQVPHSVETMEHIKWGQQKDGWGEYLLCCVKSGFKIFQQGGYGFWFPIGIPQNNFHTTMVMFSVPNLQWTHFVLLDFWLSIIIQWNPWSCEFSKSAVNSLRGAGEVLDFWLPIGIPWNPKHTSMVTLCLLQICSKLTKGHWISDLLLKFLKTHNTQEWSWQFFTRAAGKTSQQVWKGHLGFPGPVGTQLQNSLMSDKWGTACRYSWQQLSKQKIIPYHICTCAR